MGAYCRQLSGFHMKSGNTPAPAPPRTAQGRWAAHLFTIAVLLLWWITTQTVPAYQLPGPFAVLARMAAIVTQPALALQLVISLKHVLAAIAASFVLGCALATLATCVASTRLLVDGLIVPFLAAFAGIGWLFLAMLWFGLTSVTVIFAVTLILVPFVAINLRTGFQELDVDLHELGRSLSHHPLRRARLLIAPQLLPYGFAALRTSFGVAWKVVLVSELFGSSNGAGYLVNVARQEFDTETIFAVIAFIILFVGAAERGLFKPLQRRLDRRFSREN